MSKARVERRLAAIMCCAYQQAGGMISDDAIAEGLRCARQAVELGRDNPDALATGGHALWS